MRPDYWGDQISSCWTKATKSLWISPNHPEKYRWKTWLGLMILRNVTVDFPQEWKCLDADDMKMSKCSEEFLPHGLTETFHLYPDVVSSSVQRKEPWEAVMRQKDILRKIWVHLNALIIQAHFQLRMTMRQCWWIICKLKKLDGVYRKINICLAKMDIVSRPVLLDVPCHLLSIRIKTICSG